jgi:pyrimidine operon attenuation protein / uracil phosphoribosyltransferase
VLDALGINRALSRVAHEVIERNRGLENITLVGIRTGGVHLAYRLAGRLKEIDGSVLPVGALDITLYRDDLYNKREQPTVRKTEINFDITNKKVILVDDVLFTGRTIRAAMDQLIDFGRPREIQLAVLIDRGHRELPIRANYVGKSLPTAAEEKVKVFMREEGSEDRVIIESEDPTRAGRPPEAD